MKLPARIKNRVSIKACGCMLSMCFALTLSPLALSAQTEAENEAAEEQTPGTTADKQSNPFFPHTMYVTLGAIGILNASDPAQSAPSPILFTPGFAAVWKLYSDVVEVDLEGRLSLFMNYYLWHNDNALPAETEHRTAFVTTIMIDIPVIVSYTFGVHTFYVGAGLALAPRLSFLAWNADMYHPEAKDEVKKIGTWFWSMGRFLYPEIVLAWDVPLNNGWKTGLDMRLYFPLGNGAAKDKNGLDGGMLSLAVKIVFP
jgi:hypothetical protein